MADYVDGSLQAVEEELLRIQRSDPAIIFHQKFTCDACGERVTIMEENRLFTQGRHDECPIQDGYITDLRVKGCNYLLRRVNPPFAFDGETQQR